MLSLALWILLSPNPQGAAAFARGDYVQAERLFALAWRVRPHANVASNLGAVARRLGRGRDAEHWFDRVYEMRREQFGEEHPDTVIALNNRGVARRQLGQLQAARADFQRALALVTAGSKDQASILANLGALALEQARLGEASRLCGQAFQLHPESARDCRASIDRVSITAGER
jgi:Flp pilus assembly protein TadD